jgi:peptidoglycan/LPS O-acetylase OafA/YrhL
MQSPPSNYRLDIDGLRAVAVVSVVIFHAFPSIAPGGFVGVDVFFVVSGFLISGLILNDIHEEKFSFLAFYARRARRILPMLIVTMLSCSAAGYVLLYPGDYRAFGHSAIAALLGWSNFFFLQNTGYFDIPSQTMPLLHTWSLGVEEQFYLAWPALLLLGSRLGARSRSAWIVIFVGVIGASFWLALRTVGPNPKADFYWPYTRAWELALGALLVVLPPVPKKGSWKPLIEVAPLLGLMAIFYPVFCFTPDLPFPSYNALLPTLGAALLIYPRATGVQAVLSAAPFRLIGLISYSLYLWHWPVLVFWRIYANGTAVTWQTSLILVLTAVALSTLSWRVIEQPLRRHPMSAPRVLGAAVTINAFAVLIAAMIVHADGLPRRLPPDMIALDGLDRMWEWTCPSEVSLGLLPNSEPEEKPSCAFGANWNDAQHHALIWGNSFAEHMTPLLDVAGRATGTAIALAYSCPILTERSAPVTLAADRSPRHIAWCDAARDKVLPLLTSVSAIDTVLLSTTWSTNWTLLDPSSEANGRRLLAEGLDRLLSQITAAGKRVIVIADLPENYGADSANCVLASLSGLPRIPCRTNSAYIERKDIGFQLETHVLLREVIARHPSVSIVEPMDFLCDAARCTRYVGREFIYRDAAHLRRNLTPDTISLLVKGFRLEEVLAQP